MIEEPNVIVKCWVDSVRDAIWVDWIAVRLLELFVAWVLNEKGIRRR